MTPEQFKAAGGGDSVMGLQPIAADDLGPGDPLGRLSELSFEHADGLAANKSITGAVKFDRLRPDVNYYSLRLTLVAGTTRATMYQHPKASLPKGQGAVALSFPSPDASQLRNGGPLVALVEVVEFFDAERTGKPFVVSNPLAVVLQAAPAKDGGK